MTGDVTMYKKLLFTPLFFSLSVRGGRCLTHNVKCYPITIFSCLCYPDLPNPINILFLKTSTVPRKQLGNCRRNLIKYILINK